MISIPKSKSLTCTSLEEAPVTTSLEFSKLLSPPGLLNRISKKKRSGSLIDYHPKNDAPLLIVFLSKNCYIWFDDIEQLGNDGGDASEEDRPVIPTQRLLQPFHTDPCLMPTLLLV
jgi:hypothetical protein